VSREIRFHTVTVGLLVRPPGAASLPDDEAAAVQDAHLGHLADLHDAGHLIAAGPFDDQDDERLRGLALFAVPVGEARRLMAGDPAVTAGVLEFQAMAWMLPAGSIRPGRSRYPRSVAEALGGLQAPDSWTEADSGG